MGAALRSKKQHAATRRDSNRTCREGIRMRSTGWIGAVVLTLATCIPAHAHFIRNLFVLAQTNRRLAGQVVDYTHNHGRDNRIWSPALHEKRDLYVYLPPNYDPNKRYPFILYLHGFLQDETSFLHEVVEPVDKAMGCGLLPPAIIAAPDGSLRGTNCPLSAGSFFLNSKAGNFEDFLMVDVWDFVTQRYPVRPEREAHVICGASMGGGAAYNKAIKYSERFGVVAALFPPVNVRWESCRGRYMDNFDPDCWGWKTNFSNPFAVVGRFYGVITIHQGQFTRALYGLCNPDMAALISKDNPIEMLDAYDIKDGTLQMFIGYGGRDQFNIDAQVESYVYRCKQKGIAIAVAYEPDGKHDLRTALKLLPRMLEWLKPRLEPFKPE
jgi:enterochelin esterase-like enzyme